MRGDRISLTSIDHAGNILEKYQRDEEESHGLSEDTAIYLYELI